MLTGTAGSVAATMRKPLPVTVLIDQRPVRCETVVGALGANLLSFTTTLADHVFGLTSSYVGDAKAETIATELVCGQDESLTRTRVLDPAEFPVRRERQRLLLDHASQLQQDLTVYLPGRPVAVEITDTALEQAAHAWPSPST